jgi:molecular chaperone GrpE
MSDQDETIQDANPSPGAGAPPSPARGEGKIELTNEELLNNWKRAVADFENFRKRKEQEGKQVVEYAKEITVLQLMPSLQSLEQVLRYAPTDEKYKDWVSGLKATIQQLEKTMEELGVVKIKTLGESFDHNLHEAVEEKDGESGIILEEIQPGFTLNNKLIIPAKVVVGKKE